MSKQTRERHLSLVEQIINQTARRNEYLAKIEWDSRPIVIRDRFAEEVIFAHDIISETRALHGNLDGECELEDTINFKSNILLPTKANPVQITP